MTTATGKQYGVGLRHAVIFELNTSGSPAAPDEALYSGVEIVGPKVFDLTIPDPRKITHIGNDRPLQVDFLPPTEAMSAELTVAEENHDLIARLTNTNQITVGESSVIGLATDQQGFEPQVCLLLFQQSLNAAGARNWRWFLMPKATIYPHPSGMSEAEAEHRFLVSPAVVTAYPWETAFAVGTEGFTEAQILVGQSEGKPNLVAFLADGVEDAFLFDTTKPATAVGKISVWIDGVLTTTGFTAAVTGLTFTSAPAENKRIVVFYES